MDTLAQRIRLARKNANMTQSELATRSGLKQGTIAGLESGKSGRTTSAAELSAALGVNMEWLATGKGGIYPNDIEIRGDNIRPANIGYRIPLISWVRAGAFSDVEIIDSDDCIYVDRAISPYAFSLEVSGDSMTTSNNRGVSFPDGMVIVVDPDKAPKAGDYVIIKDINKQAATFKQYMTDGISNKGVPLNRDYDTIDLDDERYRIIGVVVEAVHRMRF